MLFVGSYFVHFTFQNFTELSQCFDETTHLIILRLHKSAVTLKMGGGGLNQGGGCLSLGLGAPQF